MDALAQSLPSPLSASTPAGQQQKPPAGESAAMSQQKASSRADEPEAMEVPTPQPTAAGIYDYAAMEKRVQEPLPLEILKISSIDSYAESQSTAPSSYVDSSGRNSPVSTSTATSNFYFDFEDPLDRAVDAEDVSQLRNYSLPLEWELRNRPSLARAISLDAHKARSIDSDERPERVALPKHLRDDSPRRPSYTFPFRWSGGWSTPNSPPHCASAPGSAPESRRGSAQSSQASHRRSKLSLTELICSYKSAEPDDEPEQLRNDTARDKPMAGHLGTNPGRADIKVEAMQPSTPPAVADTTHHTVGRGTPLLHRPGQNQTEDICELVLRHAFNIDLQDVAFPTDALESVGHCLEELSSVVHSFQPRSCAYPTRNALSGGRSDTPQEQNGGGNCLRENGRSSQSRKRASSRDGQNRKEPGGPNGGGEDDGAEDDPPAKTKKIKVDPPDDRYTCPYRKRNPLKFNIRDYNTCATTYFSDFTNLKRHIKLYHRRQASLPHVCPRCGINQGSRDLLTSHLQQEYICEVRRQTQSNDPEDGITQEVEDKLNERKSNIKIDTWPSLWRALFPCDDDHLSSDFVPPVELDEVRNEFDLTRDDLKNRVLLECKSVSELSEEAQVYVADHMEHACWDHIMSVLWTSRLHADYNSERHHKRRRSQKSNLIVQSSPGGGLLSPIIQRPILPKSMSVSSENECPLGPKVTSVSSTGSSLSSSWETAISNHSSAKLLSASSSSSLSTPGEQPPLSHQHRPCDRESAIESGSGEHLQMSFVHGDTPSAFHKENGACWDPGPDLTTECASSPLYQFPSYVDTVDIEAFAPQVSSDVILRYDEDYEGRNADGEIFLGDDTQFGLAIFQDFNDSGIAPSGR